MSKVISAVGTAANMTDFEFKLLPYITDDFMLMGLIPLSTDKDGNRRFIAFIDEKKSGLNESVYEALADFLGDMFDVVIHDDGEDASAWANENYEKDTYQPFKKQITADEMHKRDVFIALVNANDFTMTRGMLDGVPVLIFCHLAQSPSIPMDNKMYPMAILVDDDLGKRLELPQKSSFDEVGKKKK